MSEYRYYLYHRDAAKWTRIKDPIGWNSLGKTIARDKDWHGIFFSYTPKLQFIKDGKSFIKYFFEKYGIEQDILVKIEKRNPRTRKFEQDYLGRLNLTTYKVGTITAECNIEANVQMLQKLKNKQDVKVDLARLVDQAGNAIEPFSNESYDVEFHSKVLNKIYEGRLEVGGSYDVTVGNGKYFQIDQDTVTSEIDNKYNYPIAENANRPAELFAFQENIVSCTIDWKLMCFSASALPVGWKFQIQKNNDTPVDFTLVKTCAGFSGGSYAFFRYTSSSLTFNIGDRVFIYGYNGSGSSVTLKLMSTDAIILTTIGCDFDSDQVTGASLNANTTMEAVTRPVILWHEAWTRVLQSLTGIADPLRSTIYGRTDSEVHDYADDGEHSLIGVINGHGLRDNSKPFYVTFKDLVEASRAMHGAGIGIENIDGTERVRVEDLPFFYQAKRMMRLDYVKDIEKEVIAENYATEIENGTDKWTNNKFTNNDEFNGVRTWGLPITQVSAKMQLKNPYITSGSLLETVKRLKVDPSRDTDNDYDNFVVQLRRDGGDFIPDKDDDFGSVTGILSPETAYNLKLSPKRCLLRNGRAIRSFLEKQSTDFVRFNSGDGNTGMVSQLTTEATPLTENADIRISDLDRPLFLPELYSFRAKLTLDQLQALQTTDPDAAQNVWQFIEFSDNNKDYKRGYLMQANPKPDSNEVELKLIKANI